MKFTKNIALVTSLITLGTVASLPASAQMQSDSFMETSDSTLMANQHTSQSGMNVVEVASSSDSFDTLVKAVKAAGLADTLASGGPYTIFGPTDAAFDELPDGALEFLLRPENQDILKQVLTYHVVPGEVTASELHTGTVDTLNGGLAVRVTDDRVIVNNGSVVNANIQAQNGVVHAVNRVMMPRQLRNQLVAALNNQ